MSRELPEWIGKTDDSPVPDRVKARLFERAQGRCQKCTRKLFPSEWDADHIVAIINGGQNRESNLQVLCNDPCHTKKTREDVKVKAITYRKKKANIGLRKKSRFPGSRTSKWKKKLDGTVVRR